ncbi:site-specific DNA-methyltransferase [Corynebacterium striatum]|uniref:DNA-methyltransferase n=1 Tax=Corynebacterium striatum TaxID=43770 RepID=UPI00254E1FC8|nr:site-specific DNA-methyltransferase [Corynebacterium striatum]EGT5594934.1 site-specific DNA-methyltransferase [Corynebacterium striatum]MDK8806810.1 site-specific DNA-methyltransferase [Corynebacterium striatum]
MKPYYQDDHVTLYHGDCLELLEQIGPYNALVTDPPYFKVKDDDWDNQWAKPNDFLQWMDSWIGKTKNQLAPNGSVWVFASPSMTPNVERVVSTHYRVLNSIRWVKESGWHKKVELSAQRRFVTPWEGLIFAEQYADQYGDAAKALHREVFAPIGRYLQLEWERAGWKAGNVGKAIGRDSALPTRWAEGSCLPSKEDYIKVRHLLNQGEGEGEYLRREYEYLRREYEDLRREYEDLRRPFIISKREHNTDIWNFPIVQGYAGKHPCEKPISMMEHIIETSTKPGDIILDPFAGSGSTLRAAKNLGRRAIGVELEERYCEIAAQRLAQETLGIF